MESNMPTISAIFENGVFRPLEPVELPEGSQVDVEIRAPKSKATRAPEEEAHLDRVYEILSRRYDGGEIDIAARHNEHQP
jgi:predicted DNA-binding antitoxin AbrB/MazE fold protein